MEIRVLRADEFDLYLELAQYAFQIEMTEEQTNDARGRFKPEHVTGAFEDGNLAAMLTIIPLDIYLQGAKVQMGGVAGVSSWPEKRRQGCVGKLIAHALEQMRSSGQTVSMLAPFSFSFYRKYGWEMAFEHKKYTIATSFLPPRIDTGGRVERRDNDRELVAEIYEAYASRYNGTLSRSAEWWTTSVYRRKKGSTAVYFGADNRPSGYAIYKVQDRKLTIHELVYLDEEARRALWTFFANHDSMIDETVVTAPADDDLPFLLPNPRIGQEMVPYFMARIVDVEQLVNMYRFAEGVRGHFTLRLTDSYAPWNEGVWRFTADGSGGAALELERGADPVSPETESETAATLEHYDHDNELTCGIETLSAILFGFKRPLELVRAGRLNGSLDSAELLEKLIPRRSTYLLDFF
ncbi:hypothetical protein VN24_12455 [Paenibacillus beijingensis]|uniref:N-acetyltransferase domain-containing protein n=1 Tax=Paenibacillus beijingensis TaxID=1126833 RepID=A0A0D5NJY9_9BACL|nr:hypothetical protein VN24_12455 [Paenibacillus beijingensis]